MSESDGKGLEVDPDPEVGDASKGLMNIEEYAVVCGVVSGRIDGGVGMVLGTMLTVSPLQRGSPGCLTATPTAGVKNPSDLIKEPKGIHHVGEGDRERLSVWRVPLNQPKL